MAKTRMSLLIATLFCAVMLLAACTPVQSTGNSDGKQSDGVVVGVAWRPDSDSLSYQSTLRSLEEAGINYVVLPQVLSADFEYDADNKLKGGVAETGALTPEAGKLVRCNSWQGSTAAEVLDGVNAVVFPGGQDVSPSLYYDPQEWHGIEEEKDYNAERDISDYVLMSYCLEHDIPILAICRGMQMLCVVSGAEVEQDIDTWFAEQGLDYQDEHKQPADEQGNRDFTANDLTVEQGSTLYEIVQSTHLENCPCWHHQTVVSVKDTRLEVTARTETQGVEMIEAVERDDKTFAVGLQFHPEISVTKTIDGEDNWRDYLDYDTAISLFKRLEAEGEVQLKEDPDNLGLRPAA